MLNYFNDLISKIDTQQKNNNPSILIHLITFTSDYSFLSLPQVKELPEDQLNDCLYSSGENVVLRLNNLLKDCGCSNPSL